jgi:large subunit ribosomal protein L24
MKHIRRNDTVSVIAGKDKGKTGKVIRIFTEEDHALVQGINFVKKHQRKSQQDQQGGIIQKEMPIHMSNLLLICPKCNKPTRLKVKIAEDNSKLRVCAKCNDLIS